MAIDTNKRRMQQKADELEEPVEEANELAEKLGLEPYDVKYWVVDHDEMNQIAAYGGFQNRYPHWRWGMMYDQRQKQDQYGGGKIFEMVNNDNPSHAFLQESNSLADQKAVITHVEAHSDFFANNEWYGLFREDPNAAHMLEQHAEKVKRYMDDPDVDREAVESFIDSVSCLEDNIAQTQSYDALKAFKEQKEDADEEDVEDVLAGLELSEEVQREVRDSFEATLDDTPASDGEPEPDLIKFLYQHGKQYDEETGKAEPFEDWQKDVLSLKHEEAYYFAPQKMTKVMNEGWAAYWESMMMGEEAFADDNEFIKYADHQAAVLGSPGFNPYKLGKELWEYIENQVNQDQVVEKLLHVDGVDSDNFYDTVDMGTVRDALEPTDELQTITPETLDQLYEVDESKVDTAMLERAQANYALLDDEEQLGAITEQVTELVPEDGAVATDALYKQLTAHTDLNEGVAEDVVTAVEDGARTGEEVYDALTEALATDVDIASYPWKVLTYEGLAERHYSLVKPQNRGVLDDIRQDRMKTLERLGSGETLYDSIAEALDDVEYTAGWDRMQEIRSSYNDVMFLDEFLTEDVLGDDHFTYDFNPQSGMYEISSREFEDIKKTIMLQQTNFGKPTIKAYDDNFGNRNELLLGHNYNGVALDTGQAVETLKRTFDLWGRPVNLLTIDKTYDEDEEAFVEEELLIRYNGEDIQPLDPTAEDTADELKATGAWKDLYANEIDYDTKPEDWLA